MTLYFKPEHFKTSIPVAITAMLLMYTLNNTIASKLPQTSSIKFIDIWIIYGLCVVFIIIVLLVLIEHLPHQNRVMFLEDDNTAMQRAGFSVKEAIQIFARRILPVFEIMFVICYAVCALFINNLD